MQCLTHDLKRPLSRETWRSFFIIYRRDKMWIAEYDEGHLKEFEGEKENSFYDIEQDRLVRFFIGEDFYEVEDGSFNIAATKFHLGYKVDKLYKLTDRDDTVYNDLIQYKDAHNDIVMEGSKRVSGTVIDAYNFGYKTEIETEMAKFNLKLIATVPKNKNPYITIYLRSDKELNGELVLFIDGEPKSYHAPFNEVNGNISEGKLVYKFRR